MLPTAVRLLALAGVALLAAGDRFSDLGKQVQNVQRPANMEPTKIKGTETEFGRASGSNSEMKLRQGMQMSSNGRYSDTQQTVLRTESGKATVDTDKGSSLTADGAKGDTVFNAISHQKQAASLNVADPTKGQESGTVNAEGNSGSLLSNKASSKDANADVYAQSKKGAGALDTAVKDKHLTAVEPAGGDGSAFALDADRQSKSQQKGRINRHDEKSNGETKYYLYEVNDVSGQTEQVYFKEKRSENSNQYSAEFECTSKKSKGDKEESVCQRTDRASDDYYRVTTTGNDDTEIYKVSRDGGPKKIYEGRKFVDSSGRRHAMVNPDSACVRSGSATCANKPNAQLHAVADKQEWKTCQGAQEPRGKCTSRSCPVGPTQVRLVDDTINLFVQGEQAGGKVAITWPDCFRAECEAVLGSEVTAEQVAVEFVADVMPLGRLKCEDENTCGRDCYYCNMCYTAGKGDLGNTNMGQTCNAKGGKQKISAVICPPPESAKLGYCTAFKKNDLDYWQKEGAVSTQIRVWVRPKCELELSKGFKTMWNGRSKPRLRQPLLHGLLVLTDSNPKTVISKFKVLDESGLLDPSKTPGAGALTKLFGFNKVAPEQEAREWFIRTNANRYFVVDGVSSSSKCTEAEKIGACRQLVQDYSVTGSQDSKIKNANWVTDLGTGILNPKVFQKEDACSENVAGSNSRIANVNNS